MDTITLGKAFENIIANLPYSFHSHVFYPIFVKHIPKNIENIVLKDIIIGILL